MRLSLLTTQVLYFVNNQPKGATIWHTRYLSLICTEKNQEDRNGKLQLVNKGNWDIEDATRKKLYHVITRW